MTNTHTQIFELPGVLLRSDTITLNARELQRNFFTRDKVTAETERYRNKKLRNKEKSVCV